MYREAQTFLDLYRQILYQYVICTGLFNIIKQKLQKKHGKQYIHIWLR